MTTIHSSNTQMTRILNFSCCRRHSIILST